MMNIKTKANFETFKDLAKGDIFIKSHELQSASHNRHYMMKVHVELSMMAIANGAIDLLTGEYYNIGTDEEVVKFDDVDIVINTKF